MSTIEYGKIDHLFAKNLEKNTESKAYEFILKLFFASRNGELFITDECIEEELTTLLSANNPSIIKEGHNYYLACNYFYEEAIAKGFAKRSTAAKFSHDFHVPASLNTMQQEAFNLLNHSPTFFITGGPGSGKSFLAKTIIAAYKAKYPHKKVLCTAPTGKALSHLNPEEKGNQTLHKLLGLKEGFEQSKKTPYIIADLLIIDECSMISAKLFSLLLEALLDHTQVIFIGDPNQLPPVSGGSIFSDVTKLQTIDKVHLLSAMRSENRTLIDFANAILEEDETKITSILEEKQQVRLNSLEDFSTTLAKDHIILTPFRKGPYGSLELNETIKVGIDDSYPILITKNDPITKLSNGDIGFMKHDVAHFTQKNIEIPRLMLPSFEKAYALSIHKSQGSEFDHVCLVLPEESTMFTKELLFTAITRAKKTVSIFSSIDTLFTLIKNSNTTCSNISSKYQKYLHKQF